MRNFASVRGTAAALIMLLASASLVELSGPDALSGVSSAYAGGRGRLGLRNGDGDGGRRGHGIGRGRGKDKEDDANDNNGSKNTEPVGSELHDEGFTPLRNSIDVPRALEEFRRGKGDDDDKWSRGSDSGPDDHNNKNWREDLGLGRDYDLRHFGKDLDAGALGKWLDMGDAKKGAPSLGDTGDSAGAGPLSKSHDIGGQIGDAFGKGDVSSGGSDALRRSEASSAKSSDPLGAGQNFSVRSIATEDKQATKQLQREERLQAREERIEAKVERIQERVEQRIEAFEERLEARAERRAARHGLIDAESVSVAPSAAAAAAAANANANANYPDITVLVAKRGSYAPREVLALNLSTGGAAKAKQLGFGVGASGLEASRGGIETLTAPVDMDALQALALLRKELPTEYFHLNRLYRPYYQANKDEVDKGERTEPAAGAAKCIGDRCYSKAVIGWKDNFSRCARDVRVGVIDTDIDLSHPTFVGQRITHKSFSSEGRQSSANWHGTGVLAILAGRTDSGTPGLIPEARFFVASIFFAGDDGEPVTDTVTLLKSLDWMRGSGVKLINMSFSGPRDDLVQERIRAMRALGFVFTAAAGNEGPAAIPAFPAAYPEVIAVTAVTKDLRIYTSANRGSQIDLAAPGVGIWTAMPNAREGYRTGTSFATPFATAVLALQRLDVSQVPKEELLSRIKTVSLGPLGRNPIYGRGLLQAPSDCLRPADAVSALPQ